MNTSLILLFVAGTFVIVLMAVSLLAFLVVHKQKQNKFHHEQQQREFEHRNHLLKTRIEVQEQSLKLISQEIHDDINQTLGLARIRVFIAKKEAVSVRQTDLLDTAKDLIEQTINDLRNISHSLHSDMVKRHGLKHAIQKQLEYLEEHENLKTKIILEGNPEGLDETTELVIFRIVQEAIKNTRLHAAAENLRITLTYTNKDFVLSCEDDGNGFTANGEDRDGGIGLVNMHERAKMLGGTLRITASPGNGTKIRLHLNKTYHATEDKVGAC